MAPPRSRPLTFSSIRVGRLPQSGDEPAPAAEHPAPSEPVAQTKSSAPPAVSEPAGSALTDFSGTYWHGGSGVGDAPE